MNDSEIEFWGRILLWFDKNNVDIKISAYDTFLEYPLSGQVRSNKTLHDYDWPTDIP
jgi:hypothetical protein